MIIEILPFQYTEITTMSIPNFVTIVPTFPKQTDSLRLLPNTPFLNLCSWYYHAAIKVNYNYSQANFLVSAIFTDISVMLSYFF